MSDARNCCSCPALPTGITCSVRQALIICIFFRFSWLHCSKVIQSGVYWAREKPRRAWSVFRSTRLASGLAFERREFSWRRVVGSVLYASNVFCQSIRATGAMRFAPVSSPPAHQRPAAPAEARLSVQSAPRSCRRTREQLCQLGVILPIEATARPLRASHPACQRDSKKQKQRRPLGCGSLKACPPSCMRASAMMRTSQPA